jgi:TorA maturation chaperone TorD
MSTERLDVVSARDLEKAAAYQFVALLFLPPTGDVRGELGALAGVLEERLRADGEALAAALGPATEHEYHALLGASGRCRDCESDYELNALGGKGPLIADVAGFYRAFHFPADRLHLASDHVAVELEFLAFLALKAAYAHHAGLGEERAICLEAAAHFAGDHLGRWLPDLLARLEAAAGDSFYGRAAHFSRRALDAFTQEVAMVDNPG